MTARPRTGWIGATAIAAFVCLGGCDGGEPDLLLAVGAGAQFQAQAGPPRAVGYQLSVLVEQAIRTGGPQNCPTLPADFQLMINGTEVPPAYDASSGCLYTTMVSGLTPQVGTVTVDAMDGTRSLGHAEFSGLAPGAAATLAVPAGGAVHAGDEIVVVPPADLSTAYAGPQFVYALDDTTVAWPTWSSQPAVREADGIHMIVPAFSGRAAVAFTGMPYDPQPTYSCPGFDICTANADNTLGPVLVTESP